LRKDFIVDEFQILEHERLEGIGSADCGGAGGWGVVRVGGAAKAMGLDVVRSA